MADTIIIISLLLAFFALLSVSIATHIRNNRLLNAVTNKTRGTRAERRLIVALQKAGVPAHNIFHDLYLEYREGCYSQIDVVVITQNGLLVIEEKDYSGWLFGTGWQKQWTQVLNYGKEKHHFYNPIKQNQSHINHLRSVLVKENISAPIHSCIVFYGDCVFKSITDIPDDVQIIHSWQLKKYLNSVNYRPFAYSNIERLRSILNLAVKNGESIIIQQQHISNVSSINRGQ